jgi:hypothetical protein
MGEAGRIALIISWENNARCLLPVVEVRPFWFRPWRIEGTERTCVKGIFSTQQCPSIRVNTTVSAILLCDRRWMVKIVFGVWWQNWAKWREWYHCRIATSDAVRWLTVGLAVKRIGYLYVYYRWKCCWHGRFPGKSLVLCGMGRRYHSNYFRPCW